MATHTAKIGIKLQVQIRPIMVKKSSKKPFEKLINQIVGNTDNLIASQRKALLSELVLLRSDIDILLTTSGLDILTLDQTLAQVDAAIANRLSSIRGISVASNLMAYRQAIAEFDAVGMMFQSDWVIAPLFTDATLIQPFLTTSRITGLSLEMITDIETLIVNGVLLKKSPYAVMLEITNIIGLRDQAGYRSLGTTGISYKAERIARTEMMTVLNAAGHEQFDRVKEKFPDLLRVWIATGDARTRDSHLDAHGQKVGIDEPFFVGSESCMYPLDPSLTLKERANCRCREIPWRDEWGDVNDALGPSLEEVNQEIANRKKEAAVERVIRGIRAL